jgi:hypothetical protein
VFRKIREKIALRFVCFQQLTMSLLKDELDPGEKFLQNAGRGKTEDEKSN